MVQLLGLLGCVDYIREEGKLGSEWQNTRCIILFVISKLYEENIMKKYLLGLGAMLIGAGLMFVFTHTEVNAESEADYDFFCERQNLTKWGLKKKVNFGNARIWECKKGNTICYVSGNGLSCFNTGLFK